MLLKVLPILVVVCFNSLYLFAQRFTSGFSASEYLGVIRRSAQQVTQPYRGQVPPETEFTRVYRSPEMGLHNKYDIWQSKDKTTIALNLRGTVTDQSSWLENFYCAMIPATGSLRLTDSFTFEYKFAADPRAAVHVGWALGVGSLAPDIVHKLLLYYQQGARHLFIEGHSQGGALAYLLTSYLYYTKLSGGLPADLAIKTYCSAAPKPGNLYYAYDFDFITRGGWAFNVVNAVDWVPETPMSIQTAKDINPLNPFSHSDQLLSKQPWLVKAYLKHMYRKLDRAPRKAQKRYERLLGKKMYRQVKKYAPQFQQPSYAHTGNFMRAGTPIVLQPDSAYYAAYPDTSINIFRHHLFMPYYTLMARTYGLKK